MTPPSTFWRRVAIAPSSSQQRILHRAATFYSIKLSRRKSENNTMAHTVVKTTRTTTVASGHTFGPTMQFSYSSLSSTPGILKILETVCGAVCVGLLSYYYDNMNRNLYPAQIYFLIAASACLVATFCIVLSTFSSHYIINSTHEFVYNFVALVLLLAASANLLTHLNNYRYSNKAHSILLSAAIIGLINTGFYLLSLLLAFRANRRLL